jgi:plasmid maintenance system antidote protein VapI
MLSVMSAESQPPPKTLHLYIKEWMDHLCVSDQKLAERLETNRETVWRWHTEQNRLNPDKIGEIARALGIEPEQLCYPPDQVSLDAIVKGAETELRETAADVVRRMVKGKIAP